MNECTIIIFGASGDLSRRKLLPALYHLIAKKKLDNFVIIGASFDATTAAAILEAARSYLGNEIDEQAFALLQERMVYHKLDFSHANDYQQLAKQVKQSEERYSLAGNRIAYLAAPSQYYCSITQNLAESGIIKAHKPNETVWQRIIYEKPFGHDVTSAHAINECIAHYFNEHQIFRVDHYLTKELVGNIALIRFTNLVLEPLWNNRYIDNVQIIVSEESGIGNRGSYYDQYGALKDVVQNHILELLALIGMESPEWLTGEYIRAQRAKVLEKVSVVDALLGQYEGYRSENHVKPDSNTETFALACLKINNPRWAGVPFFVKTGKCLTKKETVIHIKFKQVDCLLAKHCPSETNYLTIQVYPEASFSLTLNVKKPGYSQEVIPIKMEFCHSCIFGSITPDAHEVIFEEVMRGDTSISVRFDEIESAWNIIDAIEAMKLPVYSYAKSSQGPQEVEQFNKKYGMRWLS